MRVVFVVLAVLLLSASVFACTDFQVKTADNSVVVGRSMEFALDMQSKLVSHPRGEKRVSLAPDGKPGVQWTSKYGFVEANGVGLDIVVDGMNEQGLSVGFLWLPDSTKYQDPTGKESQSLFILDLGAWMLGNFASVDEVKSAMSNVVVWGKVMPQIQSIPTLHVALHDSSGNNAVIEFVDGVQKIYDNPNGVLTNEPTFDWQITNLKNYINLRALGYGPVNFRGMVLTPTAQGSGMLGIPGDWTPPSRFVRATAMVNFAQPARNALQGVNLAAHILNAVDIPKGDVLESAGVSDYTQWVLIKDLTNKVVYFRSYDDLSLKAVDLKRLDLRPNARVRSVPISSGPGFSDVTYSMK